MRLLIIEDDIKLLTTMQKQLTHNGYITDICSNGEDAFYYTKKQVYDLIIVDRMLPEIDGLSIVQLMRKNGISTPVIMVTALSGINDRIDGLDAGADDYLTKPFVMEELLARIRALLRRPANMQTTPSLSFAGLSLDPQSRVLSYQDKTCELSKKECDLIEFFLRNHSQILERELLLNRVWGPDSFASDGNLDNYISFLRRRLKQLDCAIQIKTVHKIGYRLEEIQS